MMPSGARISERESDFRTDDISISQIERKRPTSDLISRSSKKPRYALEFLMHPISSLTRFFGGSGNDENEEQEIHEESHESSRVRNRSEGEDEIEVIATISGGRPVSPELFRESIQNKTLELQEDEEDNLEVVNVKSDAASSSTSCAESDRKVEKEKENLEDVKVIFQSAGFAPSVRQSPKNLPEEDDLQVISEVINHSGEVSAKERLSIESVRDEIVRTCEVEEDSDVETIASNNQEDGCLVFSNLTSPTPDDSASRSATPHTFLPKNTEARSRDHWIRSRQTQSDNRWNSDSKSLIRRQPIPMKKYTKKINHNNVDMHAQKRYLSLLEKMGVYKQDSKSLRFPIGKTARGKNLQAKIENLRRIRSGKEESNSTLRNVKESTPETSSMVSMGANSFATFSRATPSPFSEARSLSEERVTDIVGRMESVRIQNSGVENFNKLSKRLDTSRFHVISLTEELRVRSNARLNNVDDIEKKVREKLSIEGIKYIVKKEKSEFPPLPEEAENLCHTVWRGRGDGEVFSEGFGVKLTRKDLCTLDGMNWLNDEVINFYMELVCERSRNSSDLPKTYAFNTFFYSNIATKGYTSVKRWTRKVDIFAYDVLLIPVHLGVHWCMSVIDMGKKEITYYDSLLNDNYQSLELLRQYLSSESADKKKVSFDFTGWKFEMKKDIPRQMNGSDCGVFSCHFGEFASRRRKPVFNQSHMSYFRRRMVFELVNKTLMVS
ncbi:unnamed protein product [Caenorhabditis auriculariae]|uniref:Ubiquitin-like protease family profile domain-containing protein n=1 Tax=Caenorhabditis auriculariae TaxID=2777116 RepID=A0A8S1H388_9PELO|nr:unnamed protein product [Caenorhabditis auriculariae]